MPEGKCIVPSTTESLVSTSVVDCRRETDRIHRVAEVDLTSREILVLGICFSGFHGNSSDRTYIILALLLLRGKTLNNSYVIYPRFWKREIGLLILQRINLRSEWPALLPEYKQIGRRSG